MHKRLIVAAGLVTGLGVAQGIWAQDTNSSSTASADTLQEVVVTAEKRPEDLQKTAISIQAISGEELKKEGKKRLDEIMDQVVGVSSQGSQVGETFYMRGLGGGGGPPGGTPTATAVAVLIDGVYQDRSETVRGGTLDVSQVEVMRGTQSTNLGASSLAGAVSLVSNQPVFQYQANGSLGIGNYHLIDTEGVLNVPLSSNQAVRFAYATDNRNGYISSGAGDSDLQNARLKYRWQATDNLNIVLTGSHEGIGGNGVDDGVLLSTGHWIPYNPSVAIGTANGTYMAAGGPGPAAALTMGYPPLFGAVNDGISYKNRSNPWDDGYPYGVWPNGPFRDTTIDTYSADVTWKLPLGTLTVTPSYEDASFKSEEPPRGGSYRMQDQTQKTEQMDARLASNADSKISWLLGGYYYYTNQPGTFLGVGLPGNSGGQGCLSSATSYDYCWQDIASSWKRTYSAYGNFTYPILDRLRLIGGLRYSNDHAGFGTSNSTDNPVGGVATATLGGPGIAYTYTYGAGSWSDTTYRVGLEYDVTPTSMAYGTVSTGYQAGTVAQNGAAITVNPKQTLTQYTLGMKNRFFDNTFQVNVEGFWSVYHDQALQGNISATTGTGNATTDQTCAPQGPTSTLAFSNAYNCVTAGNIIVPKLTSRGVDLETSWLPTANDRLDLSAEYLQSIIGTPDTSSVTAAALQALQPGATSQDISSILAALQTAAGEYNGLTLQESPKWSVNGTYQHIFRLPGGSQLTPKVNAVYKTRYWTQGGAPGADIADTSGPAWQQAYSLYNVYLTWQNPDGKFTTTAYMKNISDYPVMTNYGGTYVTLDAPRTWGIIFEASL